MIIHHDCNTTETPNYYDILRIRNYSAEKIGIYESNDFYASRETLYHVVYDEYKYPYLIELIDRLLNNDEEAKSDLFKAKYSVIMFSVGLSDRHGAGLTPFHLGSLTEGR